MCELCTWLSRCMTILPQSYKDIPDFCCKMIERYGTGSVATTVTGGLWRAVSVQDVPVSVSIILHEWRTRESSDEDVVNDLIHSRAPDAGTALRNVDYLIARARTTSNTSAME